MEFEKFAHTYGQYNLIQKEVIKRYINSLAPRVVDLGCGSEGLCKYRDFEFYLGIDSSPSMLKLNPCNTKLLDFNQKKCFEFLKTLEFDEIVSFSALQWAKDLDFVFGEIKKLNKRYLLAIFTSNTFKRLHNYLGVKSPIFSKEEILKSVKILNPNIEVLNYQLEFNTPKSMLEYIKFSGVRGNTLANFSNIKRFLREFPFNTLEFEIVVLSGDFQAC
jgi:malonyl-CoA O-methyltransferase